jgi:hypothetical protein
MDQLAHHHAGHEFWVSSGHLLLQRDAEGHLAVTGEFLKAFYARPEVLPPPEACEAERALHARLMIAPSDAVAPAEIAAMQDPDARENWTMLIGFRDLLTACGTLEAAYLKLVRNSMGRTPPMFVNQLVHAILRNAMDEEGDAFVLRAAEMFFRPQRLTVNDGALLLADEETVDGAKVDAHASPLVAMFGEQAAKDLDVLIGDNAEGYRARSDAFDMVMDFGMDKPARAALGRAIEIWLRRLTGLDAKIEPMPEIHDKDWSWFIGLDQEGTRAGNQLWKGKDLPEADRARIVALYAMTIADDPRILPQVQGKPIYLILGMGPDRIIRMKPQNLIAGLPLAKRKSHSPWLDHSWEAHAVLAEPGAAAAGASLGRAGEDQLFYGGAATLEAHTIETQFYRDNIASGAPKIWVVLRPQAGDALPDIIKVTCDPTEGEGYTETGWDIVNVAPMPEPIQLALIAFIDAHHVEQPFIKRKRDRQDPEALAPGLKGPDRDRFLRELRAREGRDEQA